MSTIEPPVIIKPKNGDITNVNPEIEISCTPGAEVVFFEALAGLRVTVGPDGKWSGNRGMNVYPGQRQVVAHQYVGDVASDSSNRVIWTVSHV